MHNCNQMDEIFADLLFDETGEQQALREEVKRCPLCSSQFHALQKTLGDFDQAAALAMPAENYWAGYEAKLRLELAAATTVQSSWFSSRRLWRWHPTWGIPVALAMTALTFFVLWNVARPNQINKISEPEVALNKKVAPRQTDAAAVDPIPNPRKKNLPKPTKPGRRDEGRSGKKPFSIFNPNPLAMEIDQPITISSLEVAKHLERAQVLLRSFRNVSSEDGTPLELADERQRSRALLKETMFLRQSAEAIGDLTMQDALGTLEPILLDIANLPEHPTNEDVALIKERMQKNEIVATLHIFANSLASAGVVAD